MRQREEKRYLAKLPEHIRRDHYIKSISRVNKWREDNREHLRRYARADQRERRKSPKNRLHAIIGSRIRASLLGGERKAGRSWETLVGWTREELIVHLERQFVRGMSWENYGKWHLDHIIPVSAFHFASSYDDEFMACWALTNLRPLWATENLRKGALRILLI